MSDPGPIAEFLGRIAYEFWQIAPYLPTYLHIISAALFPIFAGAHASLARPSSAADPKKSRKIAAEGFSTDEDDDTDEDEDPVTTPRMEGLSPIDAVIFPILGGVTLAGLYFLIKWLDDPEILSKLLGWYFSVVGVFSVARFLGDGLDVIFSFAFPRRWSDGQVIWHFKNSERRAESCLPRVDSRPSRKEDRFYRTNTSPFPGVWSRISLSPKYNLAFWRMRVSLTEKWSLLARLHGETIMKLRFGVNDFAGLVIGFLVVAVYSFIAKSWWLTNLMGFGFSYGALQLISPTTFWTGTLVLMALFLYDIYFVFFTPLMVTVAKSLDIPIKLLFPRHPADSYSEQSFAMLGLGDIVLPGMIIGLALRFDLYMFYLRKQTPNPEGKAIVSKPDLEGEDTTSGMPIEIVKPKYLSANGGWGERYWTRYHKTSKHAEGGRFPKPYFYSSIIGYVFGMLATIGIMHFADHAQPALLYLVPGVLGSLWGTALLRGEVGLMWNFSEAEGDSEVDGASALPAEAAMNGPKHMNLMGGIARALALRGEKKGKLTNPTSRSDAGRPKRDREIFSLSLTGPILDYLTQPAKASPAASTLEDALREASELQLGNSVDTPVSAEDFLHPGMRHRSTVHHPENASPVEKKRRVV
ncbi:hypothetical protein GP486_004472 [Trichoglossum hirsutum]|uniref:Signal peptide peptidase n=1 Tax=Trichoglossum hirsutum TaxID=265104 RepID=A0A9P8RP05_9PEZI|nr:hypothetical protein GP486_004472 [Trichoglossum hirsutum]